MDSKEREKLLTDLKIAIDLETQVATQEAFIAEQNTAWDAKKPTLELVEEPRDSHTYYDERFSAGPVPLSVVIFLIILGVLLFLLTLVGIILGGDEVRILLFIMISIACFIPVIVNKKYQKTAIEQNAINRSRYSSQLNSIKKKNESIKKDYYNNNRNWSTSKNSLNDFTAKPLEETRALLEQFYGTTVIYPKYRNLPALTSIYEYFVTGRCEELTGPHGAYNMYEDETRKDTVISQLNTVIDNLEKIKNSQYMLYQQVSSIQQNTASIRGELQQIKGYTLVTAELTLLNAYYARLNALNTSISAQVDVLNLY